MISQFFIALFLSALVVALAYWRNSLSASGAVAALLVGTLIYGFGSWVWGVLLVLFFVTGSLLSHYRVSDKQAVAEQFDKGHRKDSCLLPIGSYYSWTQWRQ